MMYQNNLIFHQIIKQLNNGKIISYPTEAVFSLGCDPDNITAIKKLLKLKKRSWKKGFILIANNYDQLTPYINNNKITDIQKKMITTFTTEPITWVVPVKKEVTKYLIGDFNSIAIRITKSKIIKKLCYLYGKPLISTSANINGKEPLITKQDVIKQFNNEDIYILDGFVDGYKKPTKIIDLETGFLYRK